MYIHNVYAYTSVYIYIYIVYSNQPTESFDKGTAGEKSPMQGPVEGSSPTRPRDGKRRNTTNVGK